LAAVAAVEARMIDAIAEADIRAEAAADWRIAEALAELRKGAKAESAALVEGERRRCEEHELLQACARDRLQQVDGAEARCEAAAEAAVARLAQPLRTEMARGLQATLKHLDAKLARAQLEVVDPAGTQLPPSCDVPALGLQSGEASELRVEAAASQRVIAEDFAELRTELRDYVAREACDAAAAAATTSGDMLRRLAAAESALDRQRGQLERMARELGTACGAAQDEAAEARTVQRREADALGSELARVRSAASSLTQGLLRALQLLGFLPEELEVLGPGTSDRCRGMEVADLLEWEKAGQPLAARVAQAWRRYEAAGLPSLLALVDRKADQKELRAMSSSLRLWSPAKAGWMQSELTSERSGPAPPAPPCRRCWRPPLRGGEAPSCTQRRHWTVDAL